MELGARFGTRPPHTACYTSSAPERDLANSLALRLYDVGGRTESFSSLCRSSSRVAWNEGSLRSSVEVCMHAGRERERERVCVRGRENCRRVVEFMLGYNAVCCSFVFIHQVVYG